MDLELKLRWGRENGIGMVGEMVRCRRIQVVRRVRLEMEAEMEVDGAVKVDVGVGVCGTWR